jgi:stress response protein YsnF
VTEGARDVTAQAIPLLQEHLTLDLRRVETGHVQVHEPVRCERVAIERVAVGREVAEAPGVHEEEDGAVLVVPVLEEILVTERRIILKEEIRIRRVMTTETIEKTVALHSQAATVERLPPAPRDGSETQTRRSNGDGDDA